MFVKVHDNDINQALRVLRKKLANNGVLRDVKRHRYYLKPSEEQKVRRRRAQERAEKRARSAEAKPTYEPHHAPGRHLRRR